MYNLLIIDDQNHSEKRKSIYEFMFSTKFNITCIDSEEANISHELNNKYYDCVILDNTLNTGLEKEAVINLVSEYNYPIIMVSGIREFGGFTEKENEKGKIIDYISLNQYFNLREVLNSTGENELIKQSLKDLQERVTYDIFNSRKYNSEDLNKLTICHLSDIQFCDPHVDANATRTLFTKLEEFIINRDTPIDILVISGDIVFSGKETEFLVAKEAIQKFRDKMKRQRKNVHIILVPGNHDFDCQQFLSQENNECDLDEEEMKKWLGKKKEDYVAKCIDEQVIISEIFETKINPSYFKNFKANSYFLKNFKDFAYDVIGEEQYLRKNFFVTCGKYMKRGFSLMGINNAYKYHKNIDGSKRYFYELDSDVVEPIRQPIYSVGIGHVDPRSLGYLKVCTIQEDRCNLEKFRTECSEKGQCEKWGEMQRLFKRTHSIMYLYGHKHCSDIEISQDESMLFIGAASPTGASLSEKTVNIIELEKMDRDVEVKIAVHRASAENISFVKTNEYHFDGRQCKWKQNK